MSNVIMTDIFSSFQQYLDSEQEIREVENLRILLRMI